MTSILREEICQPTFIHSFFLCFYADTGEESKQRDTEHTYRHAFWCQKTFYFVAFLPDGIKGLKLIQKVGVMNYCRVYCIVYMLNFWHLYVFADLFEIYSLYCSSSKCDRQEALRAHKSFLARVLINSLQQQCLQTTSGFVLSYCCLFGGKMNKHFQECFKESDMVLSANEFEKLNEATSQN